MLRHYFSCVIAFHASSRAFLFHITCVFWVFFLSLSLSFSLSLLVFYVWTQFNLTIAPVHNSAGSPLISKWTPGFHSTVVSTAAGWSASWISTRYSESLWLSVEIFMMCMSLWLLESAIFVLSSNHLLGCWFDSRFRFQGNIPARKLLHSSSVRSTWGLIFDKTLVKQIKKSLK